MNRLRALIGAVADRADDYLFRWMHAPDGLAHSDPAPTAATIARSLALGVDYLAQRQRHDGAWVDFLLYPGASVEWLTAQVAFVLEDVAEASVLTARAAAYLASVANEDGGWGFCRRVAADCDSTAQALMVLQCHGRAAPRFIVDWLTSAQAPSGGFPTYPVESAEPQRVWQREHAEVTLMVVEAMRRLGVAGERRDRAIAWLHASSTDAVVHSYWWPSPAYAAWLQARVGFRSSEGGRCAASRLAETTSVPDLPMLLTAALRGDHFECRTAEKALSALVARQHGDGSWSCAPVLRVTDPRAQESGSLDGRIFAGARRVFSTAHAVAALSEYRKATFPATHLGLALTV